MKTMPMPLDALSASNGGLDEFRITAPREITAMLRQLSDGCVQVHLNASDGSALSGTVWSIDADRGHLGISVEPNDPALGGLLESQEVVVVAYLESIKVQFDIQNLVLVHGQRGCVLNCAYPRELFRFQRRNAYRVRTSLRNSPVARVRHTDIAEMQLALRVVDLSIGGCALFLPQDVPPMTVGGVMNRVELDLDTDTRLHLDVRLQHVTMLSSEARGVRLGCEFVRPDAGALRTLQRYIDQTQKRSRLLSID
jgi:c-di-GMP-binding flagellar brake protein YcgR